VDKKSVEDHANTSSETHFTQVDFPKDSIIATQTCNNVIQGKMKIFIPTSYGNHHLQLHHDLLLICDHLTILSVFGFINCSRNTRFLL